MAQGVTFKHHQMLIKIGDDSSPIDFDALGEPCGFSGKVMTWNNSLVEQSVVDCDDPEAVSWIQRNINSKSLTFTGTGTVIDTAFNTVWRPWFFNDADAVKWCRILMNLTTADSYGYVQAQFILESLQFDGDRDANGCLVTFQLTLQSTGQAGWQDL